MKPEETRPENNRAPENAAFSPTDATSLADIDRVVHEPARLLILGYLAVVESADFLFLQRQTGLTKGNLSSHLAKLESAGYVSIQKEFVEKIPRTLIRLTAAGREAIQQYRQTLRQYLDALPEDDPRVSTP